MQISPTLQKVLEMKLMITYKRNKNLDELIGGHNLQGGKVFKAHLQIIKGDSKSCSTTNKSSLSCTQVLKLKRSKAIKPRGRLKVSIN